MIRKAGYGALVVYVASILALTLVPGPALPEQANRFCFLCGTRETADAIANLVLFAPLGLFAGTAGWGILAATAAGFLLSACIEMVQVLTPGRYPNPLDVAANAAGAFVGAMTWVRRADLHRAWTQGRSWPLAAYAIGAYGVIAMAALFFQPWLPNTTWYGQWTPRLGQFTAYEGSVQEAFVGGMPLPSHRLQQRERYESALLHGAPLLVRFVAGPPPTGIAPIVSVFDAEQREVLLVAADGSDLVLRIRRVAAAALLDSPTERVPALLEGLEEGSAALLQVRHADGEWCTRRDTSGERCVDDPRLGEAWTLLFNASGLDRSVMRGASLLFLGLLSLPLGLLSRSAPGAVAHALGMALVLALLPRLTGLGASETAQLLVAAVAVLIGAAIRRRVLRHEVPCTTEAPAMPDT